MINKKTALAMALAMGMVNNYDEVYGTPSRPKTTTFVGKDDKCKNCIKFGNGCRTKNGELTPCSAFIKYFK